MNMRPEDLPRFFDELAKRWQEPTTILLIGGAAALVMGGSRPTQDVDFEVAFHSSSASWDAFQKVVREVSVETDIGAQCAESVERWSQVTLLDYREHTQPFRRFGSIEVRVLEPPYWSIGKITYFRDQDVQDMLSVFKKHRPDPIALAKLWQRALLESPRSTQLSLAKQHIRYFLETYGTRIWGPSFPVEAVRAILSADGPAPS